MIIRFFAVLAVCLGLSVSPLSATPSLVMDLDTGDVLLAEDAGHPWYPASTTKLMTALVTFQALERGDVELKTAVVLSREAMREKFLHAGLKAGSVMTLEDALYAVIVSSANDVAYALAETVAGSKEAFVERMNKEAARLGMTASHFTNPNGLFDRKQTVSARDLAILSKEIFDRYPQYRAIYQTGLVVIDGKELKSYNDLLTRFPGTLGMKTGFVCSSGRNIVAIAERNGRTLLAVVLGATTGLERSERTAKLLTDVFDGTLTSTGLNVADLPNETALPPINMRMNLCSPQGAAYEAEQNKRYPWGLPGEKSYLSAATEPRRHTIQTWTVPLPEYVPLPKAKPVYVAVNNDWGKVAPPRKPAIKLN